jgi:peptidoglycan L-alanyl-D-glutamate endopeptidase CwlK
MSKFSASSEKQLVGVNPLLVKVMRAAIADTEIDFRILDGLRTLAEQRKLVAKGASKTMRSRHLSGKAVDVGAIVNGKLRWEVPLYKTIAANVLKHAKEQGVDITWGGTWKGFPDWGHFELNKYKYGY